MQLFNVARKNTIGAMIKQYEQSAAHMADIGEGRRSEGYKQEVMKLQKMRDYLDHRENPVSAKKA